MLTNPGYDVAPGGPKPRQGGISWTALAMGLAAFASSSLAAISLYYTLALKAEVTVLRSHLSWKKTSQQQAGNAEMLWDGQWSGIKLLQLWSTALSQSSGSENYYGNPEDKGAGHKDSLGETSVSALLADDSKQPEKQLSEREAFMVCPQISDPTHTAIPWLVGLRRGDTLIEDKDTIRVREGGFYFVYSQVHYQDKTFTMGHVINRIKQDVVGNELQKITLFHCIQSMNQDFPYNTCYTAGVVKLEAGDRVELLIPRQTANISLYGEDTFFGIIGLL